MPNVGPPAADVGQSNNIGADNGPIQASSGAVGRYSDAARAIFILLGKSQVKAGNALVKLIIMYSMLHQRPQSTAASVASVSA